MKRAITSIMLIGVIVVAMICPAITFAANRQAGQAEVNVYHLPYRVFHWVGIPDPRDLRSVDEIPEGLTLRMTNEPIDRTKGEIFLKYDYVKAFEECPFGKEEGSKKGYGIVLTPGKGFSCEENRIIINHIIEDAITSWWPGESYRTNLIKNYLRQATAESIKEMAEKFTDVGSHWGKDYIGKLAYLDIIAGYGDGRFGPEDTLKVDEFLKMVLRGMGYAGMGPAAEGSGSYWASEFIVLAKELGIIGENEFTDYRRPIRREEAARIIMKAILLDDYTPPENHYNYVKRKIPDYNEIGDGYKQYVLYSYCYGIITGAGNNVFMPKKHLTRAEGCAIITRALDEYERKPLKPAEDEVVIIENDGYGGFSMVMYPPAKPEIMEFVRLLMNIEGKNKTRTKIGFGSTKNRSGFGLTFFENDEDIITRQTAANVSMAIDEASIASGKDSCGIAVLMPDKTKELHMNSFKEIFNFFFGKEADKAMKEFERFLNLDKDVEENKEMTINGLKFSLKKHSGSNYFFGEIR